MSYDTGEDAVISVVVKVTLYSCGGNNAEGWSSPVTKWVVVLKSTVVGSESNCPSYNGN